MSAAPAVPMLLPWAGLRRPGHLVERNALLYRRAWIVVLSGALEPLAYLLSARLGFGVLVGDLPGPGGRAISYAAFLGPALLASSAANGAIYDTTFNFFFKLRFAKLYDALLATPMSVRDVAVGELTWAVARGLVHAAVFLPVMLALGLVLSWWALLVLPAVVLTSFAFGAVGMAATTYATSWRDFDWHQLAWLPMFLLSASFFPLSVYPEWAQPVVVVTPLYQSVALLRALVLGGPDWATLAHAAYLLVLGLFAARHAVRRIGPILLH